MGETRTKEARECRVTVNSDSFVPGELVLVGPRGAGEMHSRDGPYERLVPAGTLVLLLSDEMPVYPDSSIRQYIDCLALVDGSVCWLQAISLTRFK